MGKFVTTELRPAQRPMVAFDPAYRRIMLALDVTPKHVDDRVEHAIAGLTPADARALATALQDALEECCKARPPGEAHIEQENRREQPDPNVSIVEIYRALKEPVPLPPLMPG